MNSFKFNHQNGGFSAKARVELEKLIIKYSSYGYEMFREFASLPEKFREPVITSYIMIEKIGPGGIYDSRLFNAPIESINRKVKDLKRMGRGFRNFEHFQNRFLYAIGKFPILNGVTNHSPVLYYENDEF